MLLVPALRTLPQKVEGGSQICLMAGESGCSSAIAL